MSIFILIFFFFKYYNKSNVKRPQWIANLQEKLQGQRSKMSMGQEEKFVKYDKNRAGEESGLEE